MKPTDCSQSTTRALVSVSENRTAFELLNASKCLQPLVKRILRAAASDAPVLIVGESGTGKELVAKAIHEQSSRAEGPFVCLNLAAVPIELAETVLFGHEKGAFTGASTQSPGYCRMAENGTLFLDEIGEADLMLQSKLLRFLQSHEIQPVGSDSIVTVDVRIVTATNRDLAQAIQAKEFRDDLYYRLNVVRIPIPPLRDRSDDIDTLVEFFLQEFNTKYRRQCRMAAGLRDLLRRCEWPGNIRQLRSVVESLVILSESEIIGIHDLSTETIEQISTGSRSALTVQSNNTVSELERITHQIVFDVLEQSQGNVAVAAKRLGIGRATLYRWLKKYRHSETDDLPPQTSDCTSVG